MSLLVLDSIKLAHGHRVICNDFSYRFEAGCHAIMGRNGVGKSTLLKAIAGGNAPVKGRISIDGIDLYKQAMSARKKLCYVPDNAMFYPFVTGREFLSFVLNIHCKKALLTSNHASELMTSLNLHPYLDLRFSEASLGTRIKFYLLAAFIIRPALWVMDEPFNGLDKISAANVVNFLNQYKNECVILFSTHSDALAETLGAKTLVLGL